jgi:spore coat polysaccharide biosynthesis protein SpsF
MRIVAIIQARFGSRRQPGKVLMSLAGKTVLAQVAARVRSAARLDDVWVATSTDPSDDAVFAEAERLGAPCFRGSLDDVLARYHAAADAARADVIVRVTSDCPLFDGSLLDAMLAEFEAELDQGRRIDYFSNVIVRTFPRGLDAEIFTRAALDRAFREASRPYDREHVTPYFYGHPDRFALRSYEGQSDFSRYRWTLDTPDDWALITKIYQALSPRGERFTTGDVLALMERQHELQLLNAHVEQTKDERAR